MNFKIKNFGKIKEANVKLDGITVICGNNNTGKSTVGKALFAFYNSLYDYRTKINDEKYFQLKNFVFSYTQNLNRLPLNMLTKKSDEFINSHTGKYSADEVKDYLEANFSIKLTKEKLLLLVERLNLPESDIISEYVLRYFDSIMNGQIKRINSKNEKCIVSAEFKNNVDTISFTQKKCVCQLTEPIEHTAYYIGNPFVLDYLNKIVSLENLSLIGMNIMERSTVDAIFKAQSDINENLMTNIFDSVLNKKDLNEIRNVLKKAYSGDTQIINGKYCYHENDSDFDFRNISAGLKSFAIIERLLETGVLKRKDVLILDEPEIHLHSEWQIIYAELIAILQKTFDLTILLVTHSFQFLESLDFFMKKHEISDKGNYYIPELTDKGFIMKSCGNNSDALKQNLSTGTFQIADMEFEYDMEHNNECE